MFTHVLIACHASPNSPRNCFELAFIAGANMKATTVWGACALDPFVRFVPNRVLVAWLDHAVLAPGRYIGKCTRNIGHQRAVWQEHHSPTPVQNLLHGRYRVDSRFAVGRGQRDHDIATSLECVPQGLELERTKARTWPVKILHQAPDFTVIRLPNGISRTVIGRRIKYDSVA